LTGIGLVNFPVAKSYSFSIDCARQSMDPQEEVHDSGGWEGRDHHSLRFFLRQWCRVGPEEDVFSEKNLQYL